MTRTFSILVLLTTVACGGTDRSETIYCADPSAAAAESMPYTITPDGPECPGATVTYIDTGTPYYGLASCVWTCVALDCQPRAGVLFNVTMLFSYVDGAWRPSVGGVSAERVYVEDCR